MAAKPTWLIQFMETVCSCLHALEEMSPVGCHVAQVEQTWEISVFTSPTEIVGGPLDGKRDQCLYVVDVIRLLHIFDSVESSSWQPHSFGVDDDLQGHFAVVGEYAGQTIWLRVLADIPEGYEPGQFLDMNTGALITNWKSEIGE